MKTNKATKLLLALMALLTILSLTAGVFAQTDTNNQDPSAETQSDTAETDQSGTERLSRKDRKDHRMKDIDDDDDDDDDHRWDKVDFSELPENPTEEELKDFFEKNFPGKSLHSDKADKRSQEGKPEMPETKGDNFSSNRKPMQGQQKGHSVETKPSKDKSPSMEDRKDSRRHGIDFSELPDDPTDEEILEFFKKYFMGEGGTDAETLKDPRSGEKGKPFSGRKACPQCPCQTDTDPKPDSDPAAETVQESAKSAPESEIAPAEPVQEAPETAPAEETAEETL